MKRYLQVSAVVGLAALVFSFGATAARSNGSVETIVFIRHGEKPAAGLGQLDCQGLNRALALPAVLSQKFGRLDALFAPDPSDKIKDNGTSYNYIRPLATIEPTAIALGMPVDTSFGFSDETGLEGALVQPAYHQAVVLVAWEHKQIVNIARDLMTAYGGDAETVPKWHGDEFDEIYILKISWNSGTGTVRFTSDTEGLDGQSSSCPR